MRRKADNSEITYQELLILAYFRAHYKSYEFQELVRLLGMTRDRLQRGIDRLLDEGYLRWIGGTFVVSKDGEEILTEKRMDRIFDRRAGRADSKKNQKKEYDPQKPYIPIRFEM